MKNKRKLIKKIKVSPNKALSDLIKKQDELQKRIHKLLIAIKPGE